MSSRRVPKGPGRRPMTDKRRQFLELLAEGWSVRSACKKLAISRSSGNRWKNGWIERQKGGTVKFVPPLEPLAARTISPRFLSEKERIQIADLASRGHGPTAIGQALGRSPSTISRELRRNLHTSGQYRPFHAHSVAATRRHRSRPLKLTKDAALRTFVLAKLRERWSPQQIARALKLPHPDDPRARVATETIYQEIYRPGSGTVSSCPREVELLRGFDIRARGGKSGQPDRGSWVRPSPHRMAKQTGSHRRILEST